MKTRNNTSGANAVVIGVSTGGVEALRTIVGSLPVDFAVPVLVVAHVAPDAGNGLARLLNDTCIIRVKEADELETPLAGVVYLAPANYHLQVETDGGLSLSIDPPVNFARPSVDVLFETAAGAFGPGLIGVTLTGAGSDGARGLAAIRDHGGITIIQDPEDAECRSMPSQALLLVTPDYLMPLDGIAPLLIELVSGTRQEHLHRQCLAA